MGDAASYYRSSYAARAGPLDLLPAHAALPAQAQHAGGPFDPPRLHGGNPSRFSPRSPLLAKKPTAYVARRPAVRAAQKATSSAVSPPPILFLRLARRAARR